MFQLILFQQNIKSPFVGIMIKHYNIVICYTGNEIIME